MEDKETVAFIKNFYSDVYNSPKNSKKQSDKIDPSQVLRTSKLYLQKDLFAVNCNYLELIRSVRNCIYLRLACVE